jgi:DNA (cytosine-5)-methyltransferase 1
MSIEDVKQENMRSIELFAGIGGIALAAEWAGIETVAFCEREPFCQKVLHKHWPDVPIFDDVRTLNKQVLEERGIDVGTIELISGGYPCQPFSSIGKRKGEDDDRHLWPEIKRLLQEIRPTWFIGENVAGHVTLGLDTVLLDLENIGYSWQPFVIPACAVGTIHRRNRVFILAHSNSDRLEGSKQKKIQRKQRLQRNSPYGNVEEWTKRSYEYQPKLCRNTHGIPNRVDRLRSLGNAVVPQQIYPIFKYIMEIERMKL